MLFRSFANWLLLALGLVVLLVSLAVLASMNLLGDLAHGWIAWAIAKVDEVYGPNKEAFGFAVKAIGATGTALGAAWTIHRSWHYSERNLPKRIQEIATRWKQEIEDDRPRNISALASGLSIALPVDPTPGALKRLILWIHDPSRWALAKSQDVAGLCENDFTLLTHSRVSCRAKLISAHLDVGAKLSRSRRGAEAQVQFEKALRLNRSDMDALELVGRQAHAANQPTNACGHLQALAEVAAKSGEVLRRTRALRFKAEVLKGGLDAQQIEARDTLKSVIEILRAADVRDENAKTLEICLAYGGLADVQIARNTLSAARTALNQANARVTRLDQHSRDQVEAWLNSIESRLTQAELDRDRDNERDEAGQGD